MAEKSTQHYFRSYDVNEKLISNIDNGIIILDDQLKILHFNKWLEVHTLLNESSILGQEIHQVFKNINVNTLKRKIKTALIMGTPTFYIASTSKYLIPIKINQLKVSDFKHMRQDVSVIPFDIEKKLVALIITDQTNLTNTNNLLQENITKVQELNKELIKERETIDERVLLIKIDKNHLISDISQAYLQLLEYSKEELLEHEFFVFEKLHIKENLKTEIISHMQEKKVLKFEEKTLTKSGKTLWLENTLVPEYDPYGNHIGFILFKNDLTDSKELNIHKDKLLLNSRSAAMGEMIGMIAHQWRQPLSVINSIISMLKVKKELDILDEKTVEISYAKIEDTVDYLSETIDDFRNFFKKNKLMSRVTLSTIFEKSTVLLKEEMNLYEIEYIEDVDASLEISTYQNELVQSIINIIKNSIDAFREKASSERQININVIKKDTHFILTIRDNAGGIDKKIIHRIFEPYFSTKSKNGTGLGLYMCKTIIEKNLNGKLTVTSNSNTTEVMIELPYEITRIEERYNENSLSTLP